MKNNKFFKILMSGTLCIAAVVGSVFGLVACGNKNDDSSQKSAYKPIIDDKLPSDKYPKPDIFLSDLLLTLEIENATFFIFL